jgi:EAL domain-containing protein (putative c-di-GMP-specific phosphodiesterase class I)/GGDEF domain-containing protein
MSTYFVYKWKERIKMLCALPRSNRALKYFPPEFNLRNPIVSLLQSYRRQGHSCALILLYVEEFHHLFSTYPYSYMEKMNDHIRQAILAILPAHLKSDEIIGVKQIGGENFCVFIKGTDSMTYEDVHQIGLLIRRQLEVQLGQLHSLPFLRSVTFQVGCHVFGVELETENAHTAMQSAVHYAQSIAMKRIPPHFSKSRQELNRIIQNETITVLAQPIMCLRKGEIFGWEMLTRGPQNTQFYMPTELFEFAYQADLLSAMEFLVVKKAIEEIHYRGIKEQVFINVTPISLTNPLFLDQLLNNLKQFPHILPSQIVLEITERHSIRDYVYMGTLLTRYRAHGFRFAIDDAGAGYSSLQAISELIPDIIKIDKSVIQNIDQASVKQSLLKSLLYFAENINCEVIAEGVEREEEANMLLDLKVQMGQGFYFARPEPMVNHRERVVHFDKLKEKIMQQRSASSA